MKKNRFKKLMYNSIELSEELKQLLDDDGDSFFEYGKRNCKVCHGNGYNEVIVNDKGLKKLPCDCAIRRRARKERFKHNYPVWATVKNGITEFVYAKSNLPNFIPEVKENV